MPHCHTSEQDSSQRQSSLCDAANKLVKVAVIHLCYIAVLHWYLDCVMNNAGKDKLSFASPHAVFAKDKAEAEMSQFNSNLS